jgi:hypothetical protein
MERHEVIQCPDVVCTRCHATNVFILKESTLLEGSRYTARCTACAAAGVAADTETKALDNFITRELHRYFVDNNKTSLDKIHRLCRRLNINFPLWLQEHPNFDTKSEAQCSDLLKLWRARLVDVYEEIFGSSTTIKQGEA